MLPAGAAEAQKGRFKSTREEDGFVIEDVSWPSIDGETAPAYIVRPRKPLNARRRLPARNLD